jgi:ACS family glucarate transporter-like MFS transporter
MQAGEPIALSRPTRVRWLIFALACAASCLLYLHRYAWGIIKPAFRAENPGLDDIDVGWLDSAFLATYAIGQVPGGMAGDRFGPRAVLSVLALVWSLAALGVAWTGGFWRLFGARAAFGLAQAGVYPVLNKMTRTWFPLATRTSVKGAVTAMGRVGAACAPVIIATFLMGVLDLSWQKALFVLSAPGVMLAIGFWLALRDSPREHPWTNEAELNLLAPQPLDSAELREGDPPFRPKPAERPALELTGASLFSLALLLVYTFTSTFQDQFYVYWLPSFLQEGKRLDVGTMGLFAPLPFLGGALGGVLGGILNDVLIRKLGSRRWARSLVAFTGKSVAAALVIASMQVDDGRLTMVVLLAARAFSDWSLPTQWAAVTDMGGRAAATLFGVVNTVGVLGGFVAGPVFGYLKQHYEWDGLLYGVAVMCVVAAVSWLFIDCTRRLVGD